ncbi:hypothetical protein [Phenylobacterium sp.]|jgi:hypothetical protein|uniref:hypothetical protein n=1 Tax=Phenylobacterium sp. TaxID=1871053 RepID=UPI002F95F49E
MRAYADDGGFLFGATIHASDDENAVQKFRSLPLRGRRAELLDGGRRVAVRPAAATASDGEPA